MTAGICGGQGGDAPSPEQLLTFVTPFPIIMRLDELYDVYMKTTFDKALYHELCNVLKAHNNS